MDWLNTFERLVEKGFVYIVWWGLGLGVVVGVVGLLCTNLILVVLTMGVAALILMLSLGAGYLAERGDQQRSRRRR